MVLSVSFTWTVYTTFSQAAWVAAPGSKVAVAGGSGVGLKLRPGWQKLHSVRVRYVASRSASCAATPK